MNKSNTPTLHVVPELQDEVFSFPDDTHRSFLWVSVTRSVSGRVRGGREGSEVRMVLDCYYWGKNAGQRSKVSRYLCVWLLLLLLADQSLQSLHRIWRDAEICGKLLLEAFHPYWQLKERRNVLTVILQILSIIHHSFLVCYYLLGVCVEGHSEVQQKLSLLNTLDEGLQTNNKVLQTQYIACSTGTNHYSTTNSSKLKKKNFVDLFFCCTCMRSSRSLAAW